MCSPSIRRAASRWTGSSEARVGDRAVEADAPLHRASLAPEGVEHQAVPEQQVVRGDQPGGALLAPGRVVAGGVAEERRAPRLVERRPGRHAVAEGVVHGRRVVDEPVRRVAVGPAAAVLEGLRQVPVVERQPRVDAVAEQLVDQPVVERQAPRVDRAAVGPDAGPGRPRTGTTSGRARPSARRPRASGGSGRRRRRRGRRSRPCRACGRRCPRSRGSARPRRRPPRSGTPPWRRPRGSPGGRRPPVRGVRRARCWMGSHPLTAPCMIPATNWRPVATNRTSSGIVASDGAGEHEGVVLEVAALQLVERDLDGGVLGRQHDQRPEEVGPHLHEGEQPQDRHGRAGRPAPRRSRTSGTGCTRRPGRPRSARRARRPRGTAA